jgi:hypothetical protein
VVTALACVPGKVFAARDVCDMLRDKGLLNEIEYNECKAAQEKKEDSIMRSLQDFAKNWISYKEGTARHQQPRRRQVTIAIPHPTALFVRAREPPSGPLHVLDPGAAGQDESSRFAYAASRPS